MCLWRREETPWVAVCFMVSVKNYDCNYGNTIDLASFFLPLLHCLKCFWDTERCWFYPGHQKVGSRRKGEDRNRRGRLWILEVLGNLGVTKKCKFVHKSQILTTMHTTMQYIYIIYIIIYTLNIRWFLFNYRQNYLQYSMTSCIQFPFCYLFLPREIPDLDSSGRPEQKKYDLDFKNDSRPWH